MAHPSIAIVVTFFGRAPLWLPAFLLSCRANPDVQWIVYTDIDAPRAIPPNLTLKRLTPRDLNLRLSALGITTDVERFPRKLCDLKVAYGVVFAEDLRPFDFWGCSDIDIVWGDIRRFITDDILADHDIVSSRLSRLSGHFTLFRNTAAINRMFERIPNFKQGMASPKYAHFDERELTLLLRDPVSGAPLPSSPRVYWREELTMSADYQRALGGGDTGTLWWRGGKTFDAEGNELMYLHFHKLKDGMQTINFGYGDAPAAFAINRRGFYK